MRLLCFILQHKKNIGGRETLTHTSTKRREDKTSQNNTNNVKIDRNKVIKEIKTTITN